MNTFNELLKWALASLPSAEMGEDNDGQLIIYTGLKVVTDPVTFVETLEALGEV